jgi:predicted RNA-binding Zn ribbon-like protein
MTGERVQPGGRAPAPGELALVQAFVNSHYDLEVHRGADLLVTPAGLRDWLVRRRLISGDAAVDPSDHSRALTVREALRALARNANGDRDDGVMLRLNQAAAGARVELRFSETGPGFVAPSGDVSGALGLLLALVARAMLDGSWRRLKVCPGEECGWMFFDHSRNQSGRWCSMAVCGGREKAKAHYRRKRAKP